MALNYGGFFIHDFVLTAISWSLRTPAISDISTHCFKTNLIWVGTKCNKGIFDHFDAEIQHTKIKMVSPRRPVVKQYARKSTSGIPVNRRQDTSPESSSVNEAETEPVVNPDESCRTGNPQNRDETTGGQRNVVGGTASTSQVPEFEPDLLDIQMQMKEQKDKEIQQKDQELLQKDRELKQKDRELQLKNKEVEILAEMLELKRKKQAVLEEVCKIKKQKLDVLKLTL